ncbi:MAG: inorganic pyrophosphatase [Dehalococcoidales bacterium]
MQAKKSDESFWQAVDSLVHESEIIIDRPKGSHHPRFPDIIYPVDYGYLKKTTSMDDGGIDVWRGTVASGKIDAVICTVDLYKKDSEIKILIGCSAVEKTLIMDFHNRGELMKGILIER